MDFSKDYYKVLGILPSAEDALIRAAYRALAQIYHPDKNQSSDAERIMREINEAYSILSDPQKRAAYDKARKTGANGPEANDFEADPEPSQNPIDADWQMATRFYPELVPVCANLKRISWRLENAFKAYLLETQEFNNYHKIAKQFEDGFLQMYFGSNPHLLKFAKELIAGGNKAAARDLNKAVRILGKGADPLRIIATIRMDHKIVDPEKEAERRAREAELREREAERRAREEAELRKREAGRRGREEELRKKEAKRRSRAMPLS